MSWADRARKAKEAPPRPYSASFEASGDGSYPLRFAESLYGQGKPFDLQVGFFEGGESGIDLMEGAEQNIERLRALGARVNTGRDATRRNSMTEYDDVFVRNIMAATETGSSDTSREANEPLMDAVINAQSQKLTPTGQLHVGASGAPYYSPTHSGLDPRGEPYPDRVPVNDMARSRGLRHVATYTDDAPVQKNLKSKEVGVHGTETRVFAPKPRWQPAQTHRLPVPPPSVRTATPSIMPPKPKPKPTGSPQSTPPPMGKKGEGSKEDL